MVLAMLDYSKTYDHVQGQELLNEIIDKGVPKIMILWFRAILKDRTTMELLVRKYSSTRAYLR